jgi:hypothetical protein
MTDKPSSIVLSPEDQRIVAALKAKLSKVHGKVTFTFIVRQAIRALSEKLAAVSK